MLQKPLPVILIVDDSIVVLNRFMQMIKEEGITYTMIYANSYKEAIHQLNQQKPDLNFFDISLPDGNGIDLLRLAGKMHPEAKSIMITNHFNDYYKDLCISLGAISFLDKSKDFERIPEYISMFSPAKAPCMK